MWQTWLAVALGVMGVLAAVRQEVRRSHELLLARFDRMDDRFTLVDRRFDQVDSQLERLDGRIDRVDGRIDRLDSKIDAVRGELIAFLRPPAS